MQLSSYYQLRRYKEYIRSLTSKNTLTMKEKQCNCKNPILESNMCKTYCMKCGLLVEPQEYNMASIEEKKTTQTTENGQICEEGTENEHKTKVCYCAGRAECHECARKIY